MRILFDCTPETMYPLAQEGFSGGSQVYVKQVASGLAKKGHQVHLIAPDLDVDRQVGPNEWWWPPSYHPQQFDLAIQQMHLNTNPNYDAKNLILMTSCVDPWLGPDHVFGDKVDAYPVFSQVHKDLLLKLRPTIPTDKIHITGLGVNLTDYQEILPKVPGRMLYANDPARGLFYVLDIFDIVHRYFPDSTLHVAYDFDKQLSWRQWEHSHMAQLLWDCKRRLDNAPGVVNLGGLSRQQIITEQLLCEVHCMPSDPPGIGTQTHGLTQMECAAAGCALVLSDIEAFPEVFGDAAIILPVIGQYIPDQERRVSVEDYAEVVMGLMRDEIQLQERGRLSRSLAAKHSWDTILTNWSNMLEHVCN